MSIAAAWGRSISGQARDTVELEDGASAAGRSELGKTPERRSEEDTGFYSESSEDPLRVTLPLTDKIHIT